MLFVGSLSFWGLSSGVSKKKRKEKGCQSSIGLMSQQPPLTLQIRALQTLFYPPVLLPGL